MKKILLFVSHILFLSSLFSCSHAEDLEEYLIEVEHVIANNNDSIQNDSTNWNSDSTGKEANGNNNGIIIKDTIIVSYERHMGIIPAVVTSQGAACFGKYLFQGFSTNNVLKVYDLEKKNHLCTIDIPAPPASSKTHVNTINFGSERVSPDDYFPLLYINSGYTKKIDGSLCSSIYVYRISKYDNSDGSEGFNIEFVQTITLKGFNTWTEGVIDNDHHILWVKYEPKGKNGEYRYASFPMPKYEDGDTTIFKENAIIDFSLGIQPFTSSNQGHIYNNNRIILVSGTSPTIQKLALIVINTITQERELVVDLADIGLRSEPENVFFYNGQLMIGYKGAIYKFYINNVSGGSWL